jgi:APA family basic amino acid/polyamine antiporter
VPLTATVRAPVIVLGPSLTVEYRTIVVPVVRTAESEEALVAAARLAAERGSRVAVVHVIEVPLDLPLDVQLPDAEAEADEILDQSTAIVESYGIRAVARLLRARAAGPAIVAEAGRRNAELVILGAPRPRVARGAIFGRTVDYVLKHSPSRVLIAAGRRAA